MTHAKEWQLVTTQHLFATGLKYRKIDLSTGVPQKPKHSHLADVGFHTTKVAALCVGMEIKKIWLHSTSPPMPF
jgi:hypothetical protein